MARRERAGAAVGAEILSCVALGRETLVQKKRVDLLRIHLAPHNAVRKT